MKRKKTVPAEVVPKPVNDAAPVPEKDHPLYDRVIPGPDQMETGDGFLAEGGDAVVHLASFGDK